MRLILAVLYDRTVVLFTLKSLSKELLISLQSCPLLYSKIKLQILRLYLLLILSSLLFPISSDLLLEEVVLRNKIDSLSTLGIASAGHQVPRGLWYKLESHEQNDQDKYKENVQRTPLLQRVNQDINQKPIHHT